MLSFRVSEGVRADGSFALALDSKKWSTSKAENKGADAVAQERDPPGARHSYRRKR